MREVDLKLIELARTLQGKIVTNDFNLNKVAQLRGVDVLNVNELANSLKPVVLPGEIMKVFILKEGKEYNQGVAYLDDGTMVVVDNARKMISKTIDIVVTSVLQTTAGKMIFGRYIEAGMARARRRRRSRRRTRRARQDAAPAAPAAAADLTIAAVVTLRIPPYHWWRTVFFLIPAITVYTIVLGAASIVSSLFDRRGYFAHGCARAWSWLILKTTGVRVTVEGLERDHAGHDLRLRLEPPEHLRHAGHLRVAAVPAADHREGVARAVSGARLAPAARRPSVRRSPASRSRRHPEALARARVGGAVAASSSPKARGAADGHVARFKGGSFLLAIEAGLPIVPLAVIGTRAGDAEGAAARPSRPTSR